MSAPAIPDARVEDAPMLERLIGQLGYDRTSVRLAKEL
jgi:hypothetical protein